jgi:hypothetical protein
VQSWTFPPPALRRFADSPILLQILVRANTAAELASVVIVHAYFIALQRCFVAYLFIYRQYSDFIEISSGMVVRKDDVAGAPAVRKPSENRRLGLPILTLKPSFERLIRHQRLTRVHIIILLIVQVLPPAIGGAAFCFDTPSSQRQILKAFITKSNTTHTASSGGFSTLQACQPNSTSLHHSGCLHNSAPPPCYLIPNHSCYAYASCS